MYGDRSNISMEDISTHSYQKIVKDPPDIINKSTSLIALYRGRPVETGPRARLSTYKSFRGHSLFDIQRARVEEMKINVERLSEILSEIDIEASTRSTEIPLRRGNGVGVFEAPRGTLIHRVSIDSNGYISGYRIIVPTMFNIPIISSAMKGVPMEIVHMVPRLFDPCIPCAVHVMRLDKNER